MINKKLLIKGINSDDSSVLIDTNEYLNALNIRFATSENGYIGDIQNVEGNVIKNTTINVLGVPETWVLPSGINTTIGSYEDNPFRRIFFFNKNSNNNHGIYCYDADTNFIYTVLLNSQVVGGLSFDKLIHSVSVIGNLLYWTDNVNPQRKINVEAGIKTNHPTYSTTTKIYETLVLGTITPGSLYVNGTYTNVPLTGGSGTGALATIVVTSRSVSSVTLTNSGTGYTVGNTLSASNANLGGIGSGFSIPVLEVNIPQSVINLIKNQPAIPLIVEKTATVGYINNFTSKEAFQFSYRFIYRDNEISTFSPLSNLININSVADDTAGYNSITVSIPIEQHIDQDVLKIEIAVKYVIGGKLFIIKEYKNGFSAHNAGQAISFIFYNDSIGIAVDDSDALKQYDAIPLKSNSLEIAKNRLFLANNTEGYATPTTTSLIVIPITSGSATLTGRWYSWTYNGTTKYTIYISGVATNQTGYYYFPDETPPIPSTQSFADVSYTLYPSGDYLGSDQLAIWNKLFGLSTWPTTGVIAYVKEVVITDGPAVSSIAGKNIFKSDSIYRTGIVFYDYAGRKCGVVTNESLKVTTPDRTYTTVAYTTSINWTLSNASALTEIPDWAYYYSIVATKCLRTSFFIQTRPENGTGITYIRKDVDGNYVVEATYLETNFGVGLSTKTLFANGLGYSYQSGDIVKIYGSDNITRTVKVKDTWSDYIIVDLINISTISFLVYEVYTPYVGLTNETYYEKAETYKIINPTTSSRSFSTTLGVIEGDVYAVQRNVNNVNYLFEAMSPNDTFWKVWNTNIGRANYILDTREVIKKTSISYSNIIVLGSETNGLSSFEVLNQTQLPYEMASIQKIMLVSKVDTEGTIMLAIGEQETASMYLGESQVFDNTGNSFLATSSGVVGNINVLRGSYGTINPESAFRWKGAVVYFDANKGAWVRYGNNGLFPISDNKMSNYFRKTGQDILNYIVNPTEYNLANPNLPLRVLGGVDPYHEEYLSAMPRMTLHPANTILEDLELSTDYYGIATVPPSITLVPDNLSFSFTGSSASSKKQCQFSGQALDNDGVITVSGTSIFEISETYNGTYITGTLSFPYVGRVASGSFWVRVRAGVGIGTYTSTRVVSGGGASANLYLTGTRNATTTFSITPTSMTFAYNLGGSANAQEATYTGTALVADGIFLVSGTTDFDVALTEFGTYSSSMNISYGGTTASGTFWIKFKTGRAIGTYTSQSINMSNGTNSDSVACTGNVSSSVTPIISPNPTSLSFSYVVGSGPSESKTVAYTSSTLTDGGTMTISAPTNFEVSSDNLTFSASISNLYTGTSPSGTFYVRLKSALSVSSYGPSNLTISNGTTSASVSCSGSVTNTLPVLTASVSSLSAFTYAVGSGPSTPAKSFTISGTNLIAASGNVTITPPTHYEVSITSATAGFSSVALLLPYTSGGTFANDTIWVRLKEGWEIGTYNSETISLNGGGTSTSVICNGDVTNPATTISLKLNVFETVVGSNYTVTWYLASSTGENIAPQFVVPFVMDIKYSVYANGTTLSPNPWPVDSVELIQGNISQGIYPEIKQSQGQTNSDWKGGIYPLQVRFKTIGGTYGNYITIKDSSNNQIVNPVSFTVGSNTYTITYFMSNNFIFP